MNKSFDFDLIGALAEVADLAIVHHALEACNDNGSSTYAQFWRVMTTYVPAFAAMAERERTLLGIEAPSGSAMATEEEKKRARNVYGALDPAATSSRRASLPRISGGSGADRRESANAHEEDQQPTFAVIQRRKPSASPPLARVGAGGLTQTPQQQTLPPTSLPIASTSMTISDIFNQIDSDGDGKVVWADVYTLATDAASSRLRPLPSDYVAPYAFSRGVARADNITFGKYVGATSIGEGIIVSSRHNPLQMLDAKTLKPMRTMLSKGELRKMADAAFIEVALEAVLLGCDYSPHTDTLFAFYSDLRLQAWLLSDSQGRPHTYTPLPCQYRVSQMRVGTTHRPGMLFAADRGGFLTVYETNRQVLNEPRAVDVFRLHDGTAGGIANFCFITPLEQRVITSGYDHQLVLTDLITRKSTVIATSMECATKLMAYSEVSQSVVTVGVDDTVSLWVTHQSERPFATLADATSPHRGAIVGLEAPAGTPLVLTTDTTGLIKVWDVRLLACVQTLVVGASPTVEDVGAVGAAATVGGVGASNVSAAAQTSATTGSAVAPSKVAAMMTRAGVGSKATKKLAASSAISTTAAKAPSDSGSNQITGGDTSTVNTTFYDVTRSELVCCTNTGLAAHAYGRGTNKSVADDTSSTTAVRYSSSNHCFVTLSANSVRLWDATDLFLAAVRKGTPMTVKDAADRRRRERERRAEEMADGGSGRGGGFGEESEFSFTSRAPPTSPRTAREGATSTNKSSPQQGQRRKPSALPSIPPPLPSAAATAEDRELQAYLAKHRRTDLTALALDESGRRVFLGYQNGDVEVQNFHGGTMLRRFGLHTKDVSRIAYSEAYRSLISVSLDGSLVVHFEGDGAVDFRDPNASPTTHIQLTRGDDPIISMAVSVPLGLIACGTRAGKIIMTDIRFPKQLLSEYTYTTRDGALSRTMDGGNVTATNDLCFIGAFPMLASLHASGDIAFWACRPLPVPSLPVPSTIGPEHGGRLSIVGGSGGAGGGALSLTATASAAAAGGIGSPPVTNRSITSNAALDATTSPRAGRRKSNQQQQLIATTSSPTDGRASIVDGGTMLFGNTATRPTTAGVLLPSTAGGVGAAARPRSSRHVRPTGMLHQINYNAILHLSRAPHAAGGLGGIGGSVAPSGTASRVGTAGAVRSQKRGGTARSNRGRVGGGGQSPPQQSPMDTALTPLMEALGDNTSFGTTGAGGGGTRPGTTAVSRVGTDGGKRTVKIRPTTSGGTASGGSNDGTMVDTADPRAITAASTVNSLDTTLAYLLRNEEEDALMGSSSPAVQRRRPPDIPIPTCCVFDDDRHWLIVGDTKGYITHIPLCPLLSGLQLQTCRYPDAIDHILESCGVGRGGGRRRSRRASSIGGMGFGLSNTSTPSRRLAGGAVRGGATSSTPTPSPDRRGSSVGRQRRGSFAVTDASSPTNTRRGNSPNQQQQQPYVPPRLSKSHKRLIAVRCVQAHSGGEVYSLELAPHVEGKATADGDATCVLRKDLLLAQQSLNNSGPFTASVGGAACGGGLTTNAATTSRGRQASIMAFSGLGGEDIAASSNAASTRRVGILLSCGDDGQVCLWRDDGSDSITLPPPPSLPQAEDDALVTTSVPREEGRLVSRRRSLSPNGMRNTNTNGTDAAGASNGTTTTTSLSIAETAAPTNNTTSPTKDTTLSANGSIPPSAAAAHLDGLALVATLKMSTLPAWRRKGLGRQRRGSMVSVGGGDADDDEDADDDGRSRRSTIIGGVGGVGSRAASTIDTEGGFFGGRVSGARTSQHRHSTSVLVTTTLGNELFAHQKHRRHRQGDDDEGGSGSRDESYDDRQFGGGGANTMPPSRRNTRGGGGHGHDDDDARSNRNPAIGASTPLPTTPTTEAAGASPDTAARSPLPTHLSITNLLTSGGTTNTTNGTTAAAARTLSGALGLISPATAFGLRNKGGAGNGADAPPPFIPQSCTHFVLPEEEDYALMMKRYAAAEGIGGGECDAAFGERRDSGLAIRSMSSGGPFSDTNNTTNSPNTRIGSAGGGGRRRRSSVIRETVRVLLGASAATAGGGESVSTSSGPNNKGHQADDTTTTTNMASGAAMVEMKNHWMLQSVGGASTSTVAGVGGGGGVGGGDRTTRSITSPTMMMGGGGESDTLFPQQMLSRSDGPMRGSSTALLRRKSSVLFADDPVVEGGNGNRGGGGMRGGLTADSRTSSARSSFGEFGFMGGGNQAADGGDGRGLHHTTVLSSNTSDADGCSDVEFYDDEDGHYNDANRRGAQALKCRHAVGHVGGGFSVFGMKHSAPLTATGSAEGTDTGGHQVPGGEGALLAIEAGPSPSSAVAVFSDQNGDRPSTSLIRACRPFSVVPPQPPIPSADTPFATLVGMTIIPKPPPTAEALAAQTRSKRYGMVMRNDDHLSTLYTQSHEVEAKEMRRLRTLSLSLGVADVSALESVSSLASPMAVPVPEPLLIPVKVRKLRTRYSKKATVATTGGGGKDRYANRGGNAGRPTAEVAEDEGSSTSSDDDNNPKGRSAKPPLSPTATTKKGHQCRTGPTAKRFGRRGGGGRENGTGPKTANVGPESGEKQHADDAKAVAAANNHNEATIKSSSNHATTNANGEAGSNRSTPYPPHPSIRNLAEVFGLEGADAKEGAVGEADEETIIIATHVAATAPLPNTVGNTTTEVVRDTLKSLLGTTTTNSSSSAVEAGADDDIPPPSTSIRLRSDPNTAPATAAPTPDEAPLSVHGAANSNSTSGAGGDDGVVGHGGGMRPFSLGGDDSPLAAGGGGGYGANNGGGAHHSPARRLEMPSGSDDGGVADGHPTKPTISVSIATTRTTPSTSVTAGSPRQQSHPFTGNPPDAPTAAPSRQMSPCLSRESPASTPANGALLLTSHHSHNSHDEALRHYAAAAAANHRSGVVGAAKAMATTNTANLPLPPPPSQPPSRPATVGGVGLIGKGGVGVGAGGGTTDTAVDWVTIRSVAPDTSAPMAASWGPLTRRPATSDGGGSGGGGIGFSSSLPATARPPHNNRVGTSSATTTGAFLVSLSRDATIAVAPPRPPTAVKVGIHTRLMPRADMGRGGGGTPDGGSGESLNSTRLYRGSPRLLLQQAASGSLGNTNDGSAIIGSLLPSLQQGDGSRPTTADFVGKGVNSPRRPSTTAGGGVQLPPPSLEGANKKRLTTPATPAAPIDRRAMRASAFEKELQRCLRQTSNGISRRNSDALSMATQQQQEQQQGGAAGNAATGISTASPRRPQPAPLPTNPTSSARSMLFSSAMHTQQQFGQAL